MHVSVQVIRNGFLAVLRTPQHSDGDRVIPESSESVVFTSKAALWDELQSHFDKIGALESV